MGGIKLGLLREKLSDKEFSKEEIDIVESVLRDCFETKNKKVSSTLRKRVKCGLACGRPRFQPPRFFRLLCIYYQLGYIKLSATCEMLDIKQSTFFKYMRLENIKAKELKNNCYKKASDKQIEIYSRNAQGAVEKWIRKNAGFLPFDMHNLLKSDCLLTVYLKLPNFYTDFQEFANECCYDTFQAFKGDYYAKKREMLIDDECKVDRIYLEARGVR